MTKQSFKVQKINDDWFAGFFDGDGYFNIMKNGKYKSFSLAIALAEIDYQILVDIQGKYGGRLSKRDKQNAFPNAQTQWTWYLGERKEVVKMTEMLSKLLRTPNKKTRLESFIKELKEYTYAK